MPVRPAATALRAGSHAHDAPNFFLAGEPGGLGPYLAVYLLTVRQRNEAEIGVVVSVAGIAGHRRFAGAIIAGAGYSAAFLTLAAIAAAGLVVLLGAMPETRDLPAAAAPAQRR